MIVCTIAGANHLAYAKVLAKSAKDHVKRCKFVLCLVEEEIHPDARTCKYFDYIILAKNLGVPNFYKFISKYDIYESACALKPYLLLYLFKYFWLRWKFVYLDSDISIYGSFDELNKLLKKNSILLTPHRLEPQDILNSVDEEIVNLKDGVFQAGFIGVRKTKESRSFLKWWANRNYHYSYVDRYDGLYLDQKWLDLVPCFFKNFCILSDPGYNMASWNLSQRKLTLKENQYVVNGKPLRFFHFSGMGKWLDNSIRLHAPSQNDVIYKLREEYVEASKKMGTSKYINVPWSYTKTNYEEILLKKAFAKGTWK